MSRTVLHRDRRFDVVLAFALAFAGAAALAACGPKAKGTTPAGGGGAGGGAEKDMLFGQPCAMEMLDKPETDESKFAPLEVGADWASYKKMNKAPVPSKTHGGRFVDTYVNDVGAAVYAADEGDIPVGSVIVKTSWEKGQDGGPSDVPGPIFVMKKMEPGYAADHGDWYYAIHWEKPSEAQAKFLKGPIYWRGKSEKVTYCWNCHDNYDRELGGVPPDFRAE